MVIPLRCFKNWICASIRHVSQDFELSLYTNSQLKVSYNTQDKSWDIDELIAQCVQEETRQKQERGKDVETVNFVQVGKGKKFNNVGNNSGSNNLKPKVKNVAKLKCFFLQNSRSSKKGL
ncbi:uncharacterized protein LOC126589047 isoform X2 [Malus sylvestris]|uniref:uncharacterized protein LOC126589047 isoform X2 n=1 Tax=Malus sylvestris TaxID=3752 RepID=UPI0021AC5C48|nr:uncharacterized protein LOC126589047 isoform X2 [Malus sylvestris]